MASKQIKWIIQYKYWHWFWTISYIGIDFEQKLFVYVCCHLKYVATTNVSKGTGGFGKIRLGSRNIDHRIIMYVHIQKLVFIGD